MMFVMFLLALLYACPSLLGMGSFPYISGDTFRAIADQIFDERHKNFDPSKVKLKDIVFVKADFIEDFFSRYHPQIVHNYILITHNSDAAVPGSCSGYLDDPKLIAWFGQNVSFDHPKLHPIPIGIANPCWSHGNVQVLAKAQKLAKTTKEKNVRNQLLYMNMIIAHCMGVRKQVFDLFSQKKFCFNASRKTFDAYLHEMSQFCFVVSPEGNGIDCHRTWEALYMRCIPIVKSHSLNPLYKDLPVLIVEQWEDVTEEFLIKKLFEMEGKNYQMEKLYANYWFTKIRSYKDSIVV